MSAYVYVMRSALTGKHSVGATSDLDNKVAAARGRRGEGAPWECVYVEICPGLDEAKLRASSLRELEDSGKGVRFVYSNRISSGHNRNK